MLLSMLLHLAASKLEADIYFALQTQDVMKSPQVDVMY